MKIFTLKTSRRSLTSPFFYLYFRNKLIFSGGIDLLNSNKANSPTSLSLFKPFQFNKVLPIKQSWAWKIYKWWNKYNRTVK